MHRVGLFDVDGVLVDSLPMYAAAWRRWGKRYGVALGAIAEIAHGRRPEDVVAAFIGEGGAAVAATAAIQSLLREEASAVRAVPGAGALISSLPPQRWTVVTSAPAYLLNIMLDRVALPRPAAAVCAEDVAVGKPDPACYVLAAERLGALAAEALVVEDAPAGVRAGRRAGARVVAVASTHPAGELADADVVYASLADAAADIERWVAAAS